MKTTETIGRIGTMHGTLLEKMNRAVSSNLRKTSRQMLLLITATGLLNSQAVFGARLGIHGGVNFMNASVANSNSDTGFLIGVHANHVLVSELISIRPEINLNRVGASNAAFGGAGTSRFTHLEIPLLLRLSLYTKAVEAFLIGGPKVSYLVGATNGAGTPITTADRESIEWGAIVGAGVGVIPKGATRMHLILRYVLGLTDIDKSTLEWKSQGIQLLLSMTF